MKNQKINLKKYLILSLTVVQSLRAWNHVLKISKMNETTNLSFVLNKSEKWQFKEDNYFWKKASNFEKKFEN